MRIQSLLALLSVCVAAALVGCGPSGPPEPEKLPVVPAAGVVTYQGKPVADASVAFQHTGGKVSATGKTDAEGKFKLSTYGKDDGAPAGGYRVTVAVSGVKEIEPGVLAPVPEGGFQSPIPLKYANPVETDLNVEVPAAGNNDIKIELK
ncbi:MAG: carboxypeptidase-like regulatory domain-containing protein [Pirellulales bacterium]